MLAQERAVHAPIGGGSSWKLRGLAMHSEISLHARAHCRRVYIVTVATHYKLEATATVYIITYTNCFVKNIIYCKLHFRRFISGAP